MVAGGTIHSASSARRPQTSQARREQGGAELFPRLGGIRGPGAGRLRLAQVPHSYQKLR